MDNIIDWIEQTLNIGQAVQYKIFYSVLAILGCVLSRWLLQFLIIRRIDDQRVRYQWQKTLTYLITFLGFLIVGAIWLDAGQQLATYLGLLSAALVVALQTRSPTLSGGHLSFCVSRSKSENGSKLVIRLGMW